MGDKFHEQTLDWHVSNSPIFYGPDQRIKNTWYPQSVEYYAARKRDKTGSSVVMWVNPESVKQSEISQKENNKPRFFTTRTWNLETANLQGRSRDADAGNGPVGTVGGAEGRTDWESGTHIYSPTAMCKADSRETLPRTRSVV